MKITCNGHDLLPEHDEEIRAMMKATLKIFLTFLFVGPKKRKLMKEQVEAMYARAQEIEDTYK